MLKNAEITRQLAVKKLAAAERAERERLRG